MGALPIGLAGGVAVTRAVKRGEVLRQTDVKLDRTVLAVRLRREMEAAARRT
jgi:predicted homoserine dehydrogenase-like protein